MIRSKTVWAKGPKFLAIQFCTHAFGVGYSLEFGSVLFISLGPFVLVWQWG